MALRWSRAQALLTRDKVPWPQSPGTRRESGSCPRSCWTRWPSLGEPWTGWLRGWGKHLSFFFNEKIILTSHSYKTGPPAGPKKPLPETSTELLCSSQPPGPPPGPVPRPQQHLQADQIPQIPGAESGLTVPLWGPNESAQKDGGRGSQPRSADVGVSQAWGSRHEDGRTENWAHGHCYGLMCVPPNSQVEVLTSSPWEGDYI